MPSPRRMMDGKYWESASWWDMLVVSRITDICVIVTLAILTFTVNSNLDATFALPVPVLVSSTGVNQTASFNTANAYPITLEGRECYPQTLQLCLDNYPASLEDEPCCVSMYSEDAFAEDTVDDIMMYTIIFLVPFALLILRTLFWRGVFKKGLIPSSSAPVDKFWCVFLLDGVVGLAAAFTYCDFVTVLIKSAMGVPRPNYHALQIYASVFPDTREDFLDTSTRSLPSGHASKSMCNMMFISLLLIRDAYEVQYSLRHMFDLPFTYKGFAHLALLPLAISVWMGLTRVSDYWHTIGDVLTGWAIGIFFGMFAYMFHCDFKDIIPRNRPNSDSPNGGTKMAEYSIQLL